MFETGRASAGVYRAMAIAGMAAAVLAAAPVWAQSGRPDVRTGPAPTAVAGEQAYRTGLRYFLGHEMPRDEAEAVRWFRRAAEQGHGMAMYRLGVAYSTGLGVARDYAEAYRWYSSAAQRLAGAEQRQAKAAAWMTSQLLGAGGAATSDNPGPRG